MVVRGGARKAGRRGTRDTAISLAAVMLASGCLLPRPSAEEAALGRSARQEVVDALRALPGRQRDCVTLRYYYDMSPADIADGLGMSVNSVKTHLQRGLRALSIALREDS